MSAATQGRPRALVVVPVPVDAEGLANRRAQLDAAGLSGAVDFEFAAVPFAAGGFVTALDSVLADLAVFAAGCGAEAQGYAAVCVDSVSDAGVEALRAQLSIPVVGPGRAAFLTALMLGDRFSILTMQDGWVAGYHKTLRRYELEHGLASVRSIGIEPDLRNLLRDKEELVTERLVEAGVRCIEEDGAEVIILGSTTMHEAHAALAPRLPVPVLNPGPVAFKAIETLLALGLTHSRIGHVAAGDDELATVRRMVDGL